MAHIETDYLVVGAGASGMAFVDSVLAGSDADVVIVDRRHRPGGHWLDAYPFVRLHQPSANYGVSSRVLGNDRIDDSGTNAGFYERATAAEVCAYYNQVMDDFVRSGRVRFLPMSNYQGSDGDGHHVESLLSGKRTTVRSRRRFVDATYLESSIPSRHTPSCEIDPDVRFMPPNDLVGLSEPASGYTVIGAGKTAMDTCNWLLDSGVDPDRIRWIKPRDGWMMSRALMQPLDQVGAYMQMQAGWVKAAAEAEDGHDFARRMEASGVFVRVDPTVEPEMFRGAILSPHELESLRQIENVVRHGYVRRISSEKIELERGAVPNGPGQVVVDCTAAGVPPTVPRPIFEDDRITIQLVTIGIVPWTAATIGAVETMRDDDAEKNRLCPVLNFSGSTADLPSLAHAGMTGLAARGAEADVSAWDSSTRLNPSAAAAQHLDDSRVMDAFGVIGTHIGPAMENLARLVGVG